MNVAAEIRNRVARAHAGTFFRPRDFDGSRSAVDNALSKLAREGKLVRPRNGIYWKPPRSKFGPVLPPSHEVARALGNRRGVGPTGWAAANALGLSTQIPTTTELAIVGPAPTGIPRVRFHTRTNLERCRLNDMEIALLEILRSWPRFVEVDWESLAQRVRTLHSSGAIDADRVVAVARDERVRGLAERVEALRSGTR